VSSPILYWRLHLRCEHTHLRIGRSKLVPESTRNFWCQCKKFRCWYTTYGRPKFWCQHQTLCVDSKTLGVDTKKLSVNTKYCYTKWLCVDSEVLGVSIKNWASILKVALLDIKRLKKFENVHIYIYVYIIYMYRVYQSVSKIGNGRILNSKACLKKMFQKIIRIKEIYSLITSAWLWIARSGQY